MGVYAKGSKMERELLEVFHKAGYFGMRSAGSGRSGVPCPDVIVGRSGRVFAIEVKSTKKNVIYLEKYEVEELVRFAQEFGCRAIVAARFPNRKWRFMDALDLKERRYIFRIGDGVEFSSVCQ